jgi:transposase
MMPEHEDLNTLMDIPGIGYDSAVNILAETGNVRQFPSGKYLVSLAGLAPGMNESTGKQGPWHITKRGSKFSPDVPAQAGSLNRRYET